jgi:hypothetical protein
MSKPLERKLIMKKILLPLLLIVSLVLVACGKSTSSTSSTNTQTGTTNTGALSSPLDLLIGTFKLEGTDNAVKADQAAELIPLWQAYETLAQSDTTAQEELDALAQQIKAAMTSNQVAAIAAMNLTGQDMFTFMQQQGITPGTSTGNGASATPVPGQMPQGFTQGLANPGSTTGGGPSGAPPSGGMSAPGGDAGSAMGQGNGTTLDPQAQATMDASRTQRAGNMNRVSPALVEALIALLKSK